MLHRCVLQLAKKKGPPQRRHVLRRNLRRSGSSGGGNGAASRRSSSAASKRGVKAKGVPLSSTSKGEKSRFGQGVTGNTGDATAPVGEGASGAPDASVALVSTESSRDASISARRPLYRLATAVATVVVPPTTNVYLQSMKHLLTPASSPALSSAAVGEAVGAATPAVPIVEEYYTSKKGPLFATAVVAGTNAVKQVSSLVPFCYPTPIQRCSFTFRRRQVLHAPRPSQMPHRVVLRRRTTEPGMAPARPEYSVLYCFCTVATESKAGVEMEALTGATMASVTLYDMLKGLPGAQEDGLSLGEAFVLAKRGGRNDFTKLLMSEPDRPLVESGVRHDAELPAAPSADTAKAQSNTTASVAAGSPAPQQAPPDVVRGAGPAAQDEDASTEQRVVRRHTQAAEHSEEDERDGTTGDVGAWWRSSKHEKRLQELYPRRKYGDNSRLVPTSLGDQEAALGTEAELDSNAPPSRTRQSSKASIARDARHPPSGADTKPVARPARQQSGRHAEAVDDSDAVMEHRRVNRGQLGKKAARGTVQAEVEVEPEEDEAARQQDEEEDEEQAEVAEISNKGAKRSQPSRAVKAAHKKLTAAQRRQQAAEEEEEEEAEEEAAENRSGEDEGEEDSADAAEEEAEEVDEEEEVEAPSKRTAHKAARRNSKVTHATGAPRRSQGPLSRGKQRALGTAASAQKKGRDTAAEQLNDETAENDNDHESEDYDTPEEEAEEVSAEVETDRKTVARRGRTVKLHSTAASVTKTKDGPSRHAKRSLWDDSSQKPQKDQDESDDEEHELDELDDTQQQREDEELLPPPSPKKKTKKIVKRSLSKRR